MEEEFEKITNAALEYYSKDKTLNFIEALALVVENDLTFDYEKYGKWFRKQRFLYGNAKTEAIRNREFKKAYRKNIKNLSLEDVL